MREDTQEKISFSLSFTVSGNNPPKRLDGVISMYPQSFTQRMHFILGISATDCEKELEFENLNGIS